MLAIVPVERPTSEAAASVFAEFLWPPAHSIERRSYVVAHRIAAARLRPPDTLATPSQRQNWLIDEIARMVREGFE